MHAAGSLVPMDRRRRFDAVRHAMAAASVDALWVTKPVNVRWLTGFVGSNGQVLVESDTAHLVTDDRYREQANEDIGNAGLEGIVAVVIARTPDSLFTSVGAIRLGIEANHLTVAAEADLRRSAEQVELVPTVGLIEDERRIKDSAEIERLRGAAAIADAALAQTRPLLQPGRSEQWFARQLDQAMIDLGADGLSFETIVAAGPNSARPHARPSDRVIEAGDLVVVDFGASLDGYGSDMTRTFVVGAEPSERQRELYEAVQVAQAAGVATVRAGVDERAVDDACRQILDERGLGEAFVHGTGHGIGLEIHEGPILSTRSVGRLPAGLVVTVEPGVYLAGVGGVRIEDSVIVTETGCEPITHSPKGLIPDEERHHGQHNDQ